MPVLMLLALAVLILGGVVFAATGGGDELAPFFIDSPPIDLGELTAAEIALLRPPLSLWGYNVQVTDEALQQIAQSVTARDVEIATLRSQLAELRTGTPGEQHPQAAAGPEPRQETWETRETR